METERERFDSLREKLMDLLEEHGDAEDDEIRAMIDDLVLADSGERRLSVTERLNLGRELFYSVRRLDILQDLIGHLHPGKNWKTSSSRSSENATA